MEDVEDLLFDEPWLVITNCFQMKAHGGYDENTEQGKRIPCGEGAKL